MDKKGYFFTLDSMLSLGILILGSFLIFSSYTLVPSKIQTNILAKDIIDFFGNTKIEELNNQYAGIGGTLWQQGLIIDKDNSLLQQLGEFYFSNNLIIAEKFIVNITNNLVPPQFSFEFWIDDNLIFPSVLTEEHIFSKNSTDLLLTSRKITFGLINDSAVLIGPYDVEVLVWQKIRII